MENILPFHIYFPQILDRQQEVDDLNQILLQFFAIANLTITNKTIAVIVNFFHFKTTLLMLKLYNLKLFFVLIIIFPILSTLFLSIKRDYMLAHT